jgi:hypothetical protein
LNNPERPSPQMHRKRQRGEMVFDQHNVSCNDSARERQSLSVSRPIKAENLVCCELR